MEKKIKAKKFSVLTFNKESKLFCLHSYKQFLIAEVNFTTIKGGSNVIRQTWQHSTIFLLHLYYLPKKDTVVYCFVEKKHISTIFNNGLLLGGAQFYTFNLIFTFVRQLVKIRRLTVFILIVNKWKSTTAIKIFSF